MTRSHWGDVAGDGDGDGDTSLDMEMKTAQGGMLDEVSMDLTKIHGHILSSGPSPAKALSTSMANDDDGDGDGDGDSDGDGDAGGAMTQYFNAGLKNQFTDIILGAKDNEKTEELPSRDKMSKVTMDMAAIYQKILNNDLTGEGFDDGDYSASPSASDSSMASTPVSAAALTPAKGATGTWDMSRVVGEDATGDVTGTPVSRRPPPRPSSILRNSSTKKPSQSVEKLRSFRESFGSAVGSPGLNSDTLAFNLAMESPVAEKTKPLEGITCLSDFLQACGLAYLDSSNTHLRPKARDSSIGLVLESQGEWPPTDAADFLEACLVCFSTFVTLIYCCYICYSVVTLLLPCCRSPSSRWTTSGKAAWSWWTPKPTSSPTSSRWRSG
jgi:hypothetical protein